MSAETADLAIVGAGTSGAHTLLALLAELAAPQRQRGRPVRIVVFDRDRRFFTGIAYGDRSGRASLTLSTLRRFLPDDERARFIAWLVAGRHDVVPAIADPAWLYRHRAAIATNGWDDLFVPRRLYGRYLQEQVDRAIRDARAAGVAECELVTGDVTSIERTGDRHVVGARDAGGRRVGLDAGAVVLTVGSPPARRLPCDDETTDGIVHDAYDPGLDATLAAVRRRLLDLPVDTRHVLVVGANATALEFVTASHRIVDELRARVTVLSPSGRPRHWRRRSPDEVATLSATSQLRSAAERGARVTAAQLYQAVHADLRTAVAAGSDLATVPGLADAVPGFLGYLDDADRAAIAERYGLAISRLLRQDCGDAVDVVESDVRSGTLAFETGRYVGSRREESHFRVTATDERGRHAMLDGRFGAIVGAVGFEGVADTRDPLLRQLLRDGLAEASSSNAGLRVDDRFRAAPHLYVVGPLLAGNANRSMLIWHAESVRRIMGVAPAAARFMVREFEAEILGAP